jgi:hypothetical protein
MGHLRGRGGMIAGAMGIAGMGLFGSSMASAHEMDEPFGFGDEAQPATQPAKAIPLKVLHANMISDARDRAKFQSLIAERLKLRNEKETDVSKKRLGEIEKQMKPLTQAYGLTVSDPHDLDYASLYGKLPPGSRSMGTRGATTPGAPGAGPHAAKKTASSASKKDDGGMASMGLGAASFIPGLGIVTGALGAGVDLARGDYVGAGLSALSAIPFAGDIAAAGKMARFAGMGKTAGKLGGLSAKMGKNAIMGSSAARMGVDAASMVMPGMMGMMGTPIVPDRPDADFPPVVSTRPSPEASALNKLVDQNEESQRMVIALLAKNNRLLEENSRLMSKMVNMRS